ncbi:MAG TPA: Abi-alpha family protein [Rhizomicrobium sp.]|nr:Abi-alpha family protein [Rhizomicrobium sp.]
MDEDDFVKAGMEVVLRPVTEIAENALGLIGGDWLSEKRARNRAKLKAETEQILRNRGAKLDDDPSPSVIKPLLSAAQDESRDELTKLWAGLLATAMNPATKGFYRYEFVEITKHLNPIDAQVLELCELPSEFDPTKRDFIAHRLGVETDQIIVSFGNLAKLELIFPAPGMIINWRNQPSVTPFGRQFLRAVRAA